MSGLLHAIIFKHLGHHVHVLEKSSEALLQSQAAGLSVGPDVQKLINEYINPDKPYTKTSSLLEIVNIKGDVINTLSSGDVTHITTWSVLYNLLKSSFLEAGTVSLANYETDKHVQDVSYDGTKVAVAYTDTAAGTSNVLQADLVIAADGGHSAVRKMLIPGLEPRYAGHVTWRGAVPVSAISEASRLVLQDRIILFRTVRGYCLS